jgi:hypothetical protein
MLHWALILEGGWMDDNNTTLMLSKFGPKADRSKD